MGQPQLFREILPESDAFLNIDSPPSFTAQLTSVPSMHALPIAMGGHLPKNQITQVALGA